MTGRSRPVEATTTELRGAATKLETLAADQLAKLLTPDMAGVLVELLWWASRMPTPPADVLRIADLILGED